MQTSFRVASKLADTFTNTEFLSPSWHSSQSSTSSRSRSASPWSDMSVDPDSHNYDGEGAFTHSPASSFASMEDSSPKTRYAHDFNDDNSDMSTTSLSDYSPTSRRTTHVTSHSAHLTHQRNSSGKKAAKNDHNSTKERERVLRDARVRELKKKAQSINKGRTSKAPAPDHQRDVLRLIYDQITPYPDEAWISQLAIHFNCRYDKIKNWFSNTRQKDAAEFRSSHPSLADTYDLSKMLTTFHHDGRLLRLRPDALEYCEKKDWTDVFFGEVVLVTDVRLRLRQRNRELDMEAASALLEMPGRV